MGKKDKAVASTSEKGKDDKGKSKNKKMSDASEQEIEKNDGETKETPTKVPVGGGEESEDAEERKNERLRQIALSDLRLQKVALEDLSRATEQACSHAVVQIAMQRVKAEADTKAIEDEARRLERLAAQAQLQRFAAERRQLELERQIFADRSVLPG